MSCCAAEAKGDLTYVKSKTKQVESVLRERIAGIGADDSATVTVDKETEIEVVNFKHLSGRCGDAVIGVNIKFGNVYFHIYILDESSEPELVKILGPKTESVEVTGFQ